MEWPDHKGELTVTHNGHTVSYQTLRDYLIEHASLHELSDEEVQECIAADSVWEIQWYPDTPVSFFFVAASTFEKALSKTKG